MAASGAGLYEVRGERLVPTLQGKRDEYVVDCPSRGGGWWLSAGSEVRLWRDNQWIVTVPGPPPPAPVIRCALEDHNGRLWLGTWGNGLFRCDTNGSLLQFTKRDGLGSDFVRALCEDGEGDLWVGTEGGGLARLRPPLFAVYGLAQGLSWDWITSVSAGPDGKLWVGTDGYGLNRLEGDMIRPVGSESGAGPLHVMAALADRQGEIWLGTRAGGMFQWAGGAMTRCSGFPTNGLITRCLFEDSQGAVWVGQRETDRLLRIQNGTVSSLELPKSMVPVDVRVIAEDAGGGLWIGTDGRGLLRWKDRQFTGFSRENGLGSDLIWALHPEADGTLWIGTYGGGLTRLRNGHTATCTTRQGLVNDVICWIVDDGRGQYWLSSHQGVFRVNQKELNQFADGTIPQIHCVAYGKSDGLPTLECKGGFQPAGCRGRDGRLWFPTVGGVVVVDPADARTNTVAPPVYVEEVIVDGQTFERGRRWMAEGKQEPAGLEALPVPGARRGIRTGGPGGEQALRVSLRRPESRCPGTAALSPQAGGSGRGMGGDRQPAGGQLRPIAARHLYFPRAGLQSRRGVESKRRLGQFRRAAALLADLVVYRAVSAVVWKRRSLDGRVDPAATAPAACEAD